MRRVILVLALIGCEMKKDASPADSSTAPANSSTSSSAPAASDQKTSSCGIEALSGEGIGELRLGMTVESVGKKCNVVRDTTAMGAEGMPARKLIVALSKDTVEAEIVDGRVWRIAVTSPRLKTADGLGAGTSIARLRQLKSPRLMTGEGALFVATPEHCGMSFRLSNTGPDALRGNLDRAGLSRLPASAVVSEVFIFGCKT